MAKRTKNPAAEGIEDIHYQGSAVLRLVKYMKPFAGPMLFSLLLAVAIIALELLKPVLVGGAIDGFITTDAGLTPDERFFGVLRQGGFYLLVLGALFVFNRVQFLLMQRTGQEIICRMRTELFAHVERLTMRFFDITPVGKIVTRLTNDVEAISNLYANIFVNLFKNTMRVIGYAVVMLMLDTRLALYCFALVPVTTALIVAFRTIARRTYQVVKTRITDLNTFLSENLSGMKLIQVFAREQEKYREFRGKSQRLFDASWRELMVFAIFRPLLYFCSVMSLALLVTGGSGSVLNGVISIGTLYIFTQYIQNFYEPIQNLAEQFSTLQSAIASAEKIFTLLDIPPAIADREDPIRPEQIRGRIEFDHVYFSYDGEHDVLRDVSFVIEPGQKVAFVGATGAGKTSILSLIGRYYDIRAGAIRVDGIDIRDMSREQLRRAIGQVQQDVFVFTGDIASNIRLRSKEITDEQIRAAAVHTNADRFISRLPMGYHEPVTERGSTLSAGERQLLSFARTLALNPSILILDEATANIDTETEQWIQEALARLMQGRTTIMVAHRLSTVQHADRIIVLHHGKIRESGTHQELLELGGIYHKLYQLQLN